MEEVLIASIVAFAGSLVPLLINAISGWVKRRKPSQIVIKGPHGSIAIDSENIKLEEIQKIIELLSEAEKKPRSDKTNTDRSGG